MILSKDHFHERNFLVFSFATFPKASLWIKGLGLGLLVLRRINWLTPSASLNRILLIPGSNDFKDPYKQIFNNHDFVTNSRPRESSLKLSGSLLL